MKRQSWVEGLMGLLAILSIILLTAESLVSVSSGWLLGIYTVDLAVCLVFAWEFAYRLRRAEDRFGFLKAHGYEVLAMVPAVALYAAGSLPVFSVGLRSLRLVRVLRVLFVMVRMLRFFSRSDKFIRQSGLIYLLAASISIIFIGAFAALVLEGGSPNAQINNFSDALWWSISTVTTVGYGDIVPNSIAGRIMGMGLMAVGIGVMAAAISQVSAVLVESRLKSSRNTEDLRKTMVAEIKNRIEHIDRLSDSEVVLLTQMIQSLRGIRED